MVNVIAMGTIGPLSDTLVNLTSLYANFLAAQAKLYNDPEEGTDWDIRVQEAVIVAIEAISVAIQEQAVYAGRPTPVVLAPGGSA